MTHLVGTVAAAILIASAGGGGGLEVKWGAGCTSLSAAFPGEEVRYPDDMLRGAFPPPGAPPQLQFEKKWPVVAMRARWSEGVKGWPQGYRADAVDLIVMHACDAQLYTQVFPDYILSSGFTYPPEYLKEAQKPGFDLAGALRGKEAAYRVKVRAGFGAADYEIKTRIRIGLSVDGKTVFYHDRPSYISDYLASRDFFFAARDAGDRIDFEVRMACVCAQAVLLRGESMRRVEETGRYFVRRLYEELREPPTVDEIEKYFRKIESR